MSTGTLSWPTAIKIAWRESRASAVKFAFVIAAVAVGVGSLTGVRGFSSAFKTMLNREARTLMAADVSARLFVLPDENQQKLLDNLKSRGVQETWITETLTMASAVGGTPLLVSAKAVDPGVYPFYGTIRFAPDLPIQEVLKPDTVALSDDVAVRLNAKAGDTVRLGGQDYRVSAIVVTEPDRMNGSLNVGPRLMMSRAALDRTGLLGPGSRAAQRFLFKLGAPGAPEVAEVRDSLKKAFPDALVIDYRESHPAITNGLDRSTTFLTLVSLIALIVGALGVATSIHSHLQQKMDSIAIMKCLGARSSQVVRIYLAQAMGLGLAGGLLGVGVGTVVQLAFPRLIARYFQIQPGFTWDWASVVQGLIAGLLSTLLFALPPLLSVRGIRPNLILRREMADARPTLADRWRQGRSSLGVSLLILVGMAGLAAWLAGGQWRDSLRMGAYFVGGLTGSLLVLAAVAWALLRSLRLLLKVWPDGWPASWRHGLANLYRPGNQAGAVLVAFGLGVMFTSTIYLVQRSMLQEIAASAPPGLPNVYLIDVQASQRQAVIDALAKQPGIENAVELIPAIAARIVRFNGTEMASLEQKNPARRFRATLSVTWADKKPSYASLVNGAWWNPDAAGVVSIRDDVAKALNLGIGSKLELTSTSQQLLVSVAAIHKVDEVRPGNTTPMIFSRRTLEGLPTIYFGGLRVRPQSVAQLQRELYAQFPTVSVINVADVIQTVQEVVDQIALIVRFISAFAILAGVVILASSVAGTRFRRIREVVILKTLGGTRSRIGRIFSAEFTLLGGVAGLIGGLLASLFSNLLLVRFFSGSWQFNWPAALVAMSGAAVIANVAGWAASARILGQKPLEVLRSE